MEQCNRAEQNTAKLQLKSALGMCVCVCFVKQRRKHFQVAEHLVESNLQSVDSHGVIRLTQYTDQVSKVRLAKIFPDNQVRKGLLVPDGRPSERR